MKFYIIPFVACTFLSLSLVTPALAAKIPPASSGNKREMCLLDAHIEFFDCVEAAETLEEEDICYNAMLLEEEECMECYHNF